MGRRTDRYSLKYALIVFGFWSTATSLGQPVSSLYRDGVVCLEQEDLVCAITHIEEAYNLEKSDSVSYYRALIHYLLEEESQAISLLERVMDESPTYEPAPLLLAQIYDEKLDFKLAARTISAYIDANPENCYGYLARARIYRKYLDPTEFISENLETALFACDDSGAVEALLLLGDNYFQTEEYGKAYNAYQEVLELAPENPKVLYDVATYKASIGEYEEATELFEQYKIKRPNDYDVIFQLGYCYMASEDYANSVTAYTRYIKSDSTDAEGWYSRGLALAANKQYNEALVDLERAYSLSDSLDEALYNIALVHQHKGAYKKGTERYNSYLMKMPNDPEGYYNRGLCKYYSDDPHGACLDWRRMLDLGRKDLWKLVKSLCDD